MLEKASNEIKVEIEELEAEAGAYTRPLLRSS